MCLSGACRTRVQAHSAYRAGRANVELRRPGPSRSVRREIRGPHCTCCGSPPESWTPLRRALNPLTLPAARCVIPVGSELWGEQRLQRQQPGYRGVQM